MSGIKDLADILRVRLKSPVFGAITLSFILTNWKPLFFLAFSSSPIPSRFEYFDEHTNLASLAGWPILIGIAFALLSPWITLLFTTLIDKPADLLKSLQSKAKFSDMYRQLENEIAINLRRQAQENAILDQAKIDEEVESIKSPTIREKAKEEIENIRNPNSSGTMNEKVEINTDADEILYLNGLINSFERVIENQSVAGANTTKLEESLAAYRHLLKRLLEKD